MCGICGKISYDGMPVKTDQLIRMCRAIAHRGPDDHGIYQKDMTEPSGRKVSVGLGHTRLSIIDLSPSGHQPMANEDGTVWIVFNGEIYNYRDLRADLERKGHRFTSLSDTEVIIHLYEEEGIEAARHLNGMFAFALWDERIPRFWLCRDRIGIKPLVYSWNEQTLCFASEIKALLELSGSPMEIDHEALELYLAFNYVPAPYTMYKGIRKLEPGHSLILENAKIEKKKFWTLPQHTDRIQPVGSEDYRESHYRKALFDTLSDAVASHMIADVPLGAFLSGGIDSSIVVALMAMHSNQPVKTFSIGFADADLFDETRYAREVAKQYRTDHHEFRLVGRDMLEIFKTVLSTFDEPFADSSAIPTYIVSMHTRQHVKVALSGDGGDELFAGYRSYLGEYWHPAYAKLPLFIRSALEEVIRCLPDSRDVKWMEMVRRLKKFFNASRGNYAQRLLALKAVFPQPLRHVLLMNTPSGKAGSGVDIAQNWIDQLIDGFLGDRINTMLYTDFADSLPGDMLNKVDWMSMQHALEVRVPFLDHRVVELAFEMPGYLKIKGLTTKHILRQTFRHMLPSSLMRRPKAGFEIPVGQWLKTDLSFLITDYLSEKRISKQAIFNPIVVKQLVSDFWRNRTDTAWMLWNLIVFQYWYDTYFQRHSRQ